MPSVSVDPRNRDIISAALFCTEHCLSILVYSSIHSALGTTALPWIPNALTILYSPTATQKNQAAELLLQTSERALLHCTVRSGERDRDMRPHCQLDCRGIHPFLFPCHPCRAHSCTIPSRHCPLVIGFYLWYRLSRHYCGCGSCSTYLLG